MRNAAWVGAALGGLDAFNSIQTPVLRERIRLVLEASFACAFIGASLGIGIGTIELLWARRGRDSFRTIARRPISTVRLGSFALAAIPALALLVFVMRSAEHIELETLRWSLLILGAAISIAMALFGAHFAEPALRFAIHKRSPIFREYSPSARYAARVMIPTLVVGGSLLLTYGVNLGLLRRPLLLAVFLVIERWTFLVTRSRLLFGWRHHSGALLLFSLFAAGPWLTRRGSEDFQHLTRATLLPDVLEIAQRLTPASPTQVHKSSESRTWTPEPRFSHHLVPVDSHFNVVWYIVDSLRADHLRIYGYSNETCPTLTMLANESFVFERAYSQSSTTSLSIPSMFSGRNPISMQWHQGGYPVASPTERYISNAFAAEGYLTFLAINHWVKEQVPGIQYGFQNVAVSPPNVNWRSGDYLLLNLLKIVDTALKSGQPLFAVAHVDDVHHPYMSAVGKSVPNFAASGDRAAYDSGIALFDQGLRVLIEKLKLDGAWDRTVLIVTADHGEEFNEHGGTIHSRTCYEEVTHVPLLIRIPNAGAARVSSPVALLDVVPTLLELLNQRTSELPLDGQSLFLPVYEPESVKPDRPLFCTIYQLMAGRPRFFLRSVRRGTWSYFEEMYSGHRELFDRRHDPYETTDISKARESDSTRSQLRNLLSRVSEGNLYRISEGSE